MHSVRALSSLTLTVRSDSVVKLLAPHKSFMWVSNCINALSRWASTGCLPCSPPWEPTLELWRCRSSTWSTTQPSRSALSITRLQGEGKIGWQLTKEYTMAAGLLVSGSGGCSTRRREQVSRLTDQWWNDWKKFRRMSIKLWAIKEDITFWFQKVSWILSTVLSQKVGWSPQRLSSPYPSPLHAGGLIAVLR